MNLCWKRNGIVPLTITMLFLGGCRVHIPAPTISPSPIPVVQTSEVNLQASVPLSIIQTAVNNVVPTQTGADPYTVNINGGADNCGKGVSFGYHVTRGAINLSASGSTVSASAELDYWAKGRAKSPCLLGGGPMIYGSCGDGGALRGLSLTLRSTFSGIGTNWSPLVDTSLADLHALNNCDVTLININVTRDVVNGVSAEINRVLPSLDQTLAKSLNLQDRAQSGWNYLLSPIKLGDGFWLSIHPQAIGLFPLEGNTLSLSAGMRITAMPELIFASAEPPADSTTLPPPTAVPASNTFSIELPIEGGYEDISAQIGKELSLQSGGIRYPPTGSNYLTVKGASLFGYGKQAVLRVDGQISGILGKQATIYLVGTPSYDSGTNVLSFPDMAFSVESHNLLLKLAAWLDQDNLRTDLRSRVIFDTSKEVNEAKSRLQSGLNQTVGIATLAGSVNQLKLLDIYTDPDKGQIKALFEANGTLNVVLK